MGGRWFLGVPPEGRILKRRRDIFELMGVEPISFSELERMARALGIGTATLCRHLKSLVEIGLIRRMVDPSTHPPRVFYHRAPLPSPSDEAIIPPQPDQPGKLEAWITGCLHHLKYRLLIHLAIGLSREREEELQGFQRELRQAFQLLIRTQGEAREGTILTHLLTMASREREEAEKLLHPGSGKRRRA